MAKNEATLLIRIKEAGGEILDKIGSSISFIGSSAAKAGAGIIAFGAAAIHSFKQSEEATNALNQSMVQQGIYTSKLAENYKNMADNLQRNTTFADEEITASQALLQSHLGQIPITEKLMQATVDLAAAKKIDLATAADLVGKSIGTETNALSRHGIQIDSSASKTEKLAQLTESLNSKFGGQAAAAAQGLGSLEQLKNVMDDVLETVGERLAPFITFFVVQLKNFSIALRENKDFVEGLDGSIKFISKSFSVLKNVILGTVEVISTGLASAIESVSLLTSGQFSQAKEVAKIGMEEIGNIVKERKSTLNEEINMIDSVQAETDEMKRQNELALLQQAENRKLEIKKEGNLSQFTEAQKQAAKMYGIELKTKDDLKKLDDLKVKDRASFLSQIATLQDSNSKILAAIGKAAAIAQITISTAESAAAGFRWGMTIGGPPLAAAFQGLAYAAGAAQIARVSGVQLAEGGIVRATPGGVNATIGEGGRDEAVIPLDSPEAQGRLGGGTTIVFNGPVLGDESQAMEFARAIDRSLLKLRQSNQSVAFETDIF